MKILLKEMSMACLNSLSAALRLFHSFVHSHNKKPLILNEKNRARKIIIMNEYV